jgi:hypothetical protein
MDFLRTLHGHNKWLVLLTLVVTLIVLTRTWLGGRDYGKLPRALYGATAGILGLQVLGGLILLTQYGFALPHVIEHFGTMLIAFVVAHVPFRFKQRPGPERARLGVMCLGAATLLIIVGIARLPYPFFGGSKQAAAAAAAASPPSAP